MTKRITTGKKFMQNYRRMSMRKLKGLSEITEDEIYSSNSSSTNTNSNSGNDETPLPEVVVGIPLRKKSSVHFNPIIKTSYYNLTDPASKIYRDSKTASDELYKMKSFTLKISLGIILFLTTLTFVVFINNIMISKISIESRLFNFLNPEKHLILLDINQNISYKLKYLNQEEKNKMMKLDNRYQLVKTLKNIVTMKKTKKDEDFDLIMSFNLNGLKFVSKKILNHLKGKDEGLILFIDNQNNLETFLKENPNFSIYYLSHKVENTLKIIDFKPKVCGILKRSGPLERFFKKNVNLNNEIIPETFLEEMRKIPKVVDIESGEIYFQFNTSKEKYSAIIEKNNEFFKREISMIYHNKLFGIYFLILIMGSGMLIASEYLYWMPRTVLTFIEDESLLNG